MIHRIVDRIQWNSVVVTQINGSRVVPAKELGEIFTEFGCSRVLTEPNVEQAFELARKEKKDGLLFCAGSLYLWEKSRSIWSLRRQTMINFEEELKKFAESGCR